MQTAWWCPRSLPDDAPRKSTTSREAVTCIRKRSKLLMVESTLFARRLCKLGRILDAFSCLIPTLRYISIFRVRLVRSGLGAHERFGSGPGWVLDCGFCRQSFRRAVVHVLRLLDASMKPYVDATKRHSFLGSLGPSLEPINYLAASKARPCERGAF